MPVILWLDKGGVDLTNHRYHELDSLRAIAALGVICWHYVNIYHASPFGHVLAPFYGRGLLMVDFFFVLSGFVLARAFWTDARATKLASNVKARIARLYPLHLVTLCAVAAMQWYLVAHLGKDPFIYASNDGYHFALNLLLLNASGLQHGFSFNAPSWSISTEFLVNLLFLAIIVTPRRAAKTMIWFVAVASLAMMCVRGVINGTPAFGWLDNDLIRTAAGFFVGVLAFQLHLRLGQVWALACDVAAIACIGAGLAYLAGSPSHFGDLVVCYVIYPATILFVIRSFLMRTALCVRPMVYLGEISYSIYLVHFPLLLGIHLWSVVTGIVVPSGSRLFFVGLVLAIIVLAGITFRWIEMPGKRFFASLPLRRRDINSTATDF